MSAVHSLIGSTRPEDDLAIKEQVLRIFEVSYNALVCCKKPPETKKKIKSLKFCPFDRRTICELLRISGINFENSPS